MAHWTSVSHKQAWVKMYCIYSVKLYKKLYIQGIGCQRSLAEMISDKLTEMDTHLPNKHDLICIIWFRIISQIVLTISTYYRWLYGYANLINVMVSEGCPGHVVCTIIGKVSRVTGHWHHYYNNIIMGVIASQITSLTIVYSTAYSDADQRKHQSSASLVFVRGIHRGTVNSPHKWPVTRKSFPFDDVIMTIMNWCIFRG